MRRGRPAAPTGRQAATFINQVEGYLLLQAEQEQARHEAAALCDRLPWLTTAQAQDLSHHYINHRLTLTRNALQAIADRAAALQAEYETRYTGLRHTLLKRHALLAVLLLIGAGTASTVVWLFAR
ncbi:hypothetical protein [Streptomyces massasporeus]|uniref:hypothetical protein n=1 Tax=Streptomyces massasporeus TaxID=67324 RepID=UPI0036FB1E69